MQLNGPDYLILRQDGPTRLVIEERSALLHRGLHELRPRRYSSAKLFATVARQLAERSALPLASVGVVMPLGHLTDAEDTASALIGLPNVDMAPAVFSSLLGQLGGVRARRLVVVAGDGETTTSAAHLRLAQSLAVQNPQVEQRLSQQLAATMAKQHGEFVAPGFERNRLVLEERPGKAVLLSLAEPTARVLQKAWQTLGQRSLTEPGRVPTQVPSGWGVGGIIVSDIEHAGKTSARPFTFSALSLRLTSPHIQIDTGHRLRAVAMQWLAEIGGFDVSSLRRIAVCVPWMALAATISSAFVVKGSPFPVVSYPDYLQGWQPLLSLLEFLCSPEVPALLINTGRYPEVHLAAVWQ